MNLVREHINFERGIDPKQAMGIGQLPEMIKEMEKDNWDFWEAEPNHQIDWAIRCRKYEFIPLIINMGGDLNKMVQEIFSFDPTFGGTFDETNPAVKWSLKRKEQLKTDLIELGYLKESNFERGLKPKEAMRIGETWQTNLVKIFLNNLKNDYQLDVSDDRYLGFINVYEDGFVNQNMKDAFKIFVDTWPKYKKLMEEIGLELPEQFKPDIEETLFQNKK